MENTPEKTPEKARQNGEYSSDSIKVLKGLDAVRKRPGMYIGDTDDGSGLHHMVFEVSDNAIDEALAGHCDLVLIELNPDDSVSVEDNGRGIPVDVHKKFKKPAVELILTTLHAGGKFEAKNYLHSGGLHGVGASVVTALSDKMTVRIKRGGHEHVQSFSRGKPTGRMKKGRKIRGTGTSIEFHPDPKIFSKVKFFPTRFNPFF